MCSGAGDTFSRRRGASLPVLVFSTTICFLFYCSLCLLTARFLWIVGGSRSRRTLRRRRELRLFVVLLPVVLPLRIVLLPAVSREDSFAAVLLWSSDSDLVVPPSVCRLSSQAVELAQIFQPCMEPRLQPPLPPLSLPSSIAHGSLKSRVGGVPPLTLILEPEARRVLSSNSPIFHVYLRFTMLIPDQRLTPTILLPPHLPCPITRSFARHPFVCGLGLLVDMGLKNPVSFSCLFPSPTVLKPMCLWGILVILANFLRIFSGFIEIFTKASMNTMSYLSCLKRSLSLLLPVDSSGQSPSSPPLSSFFSKKRTVLPPPSFKRNVSSPNVKWRCVSLSITVLLSCVAVRLGHERMLFR